MTDRASVTVIGLGLMGSALAGAFLAAGHRTVVWNRTRRKADALAAQGAEVAATVEAALTAGPLVVACVSTYEALRELLAPEAASLRGRTLVNLTSGSPEQAREMAAWAEERGIGYLDGAIMATPQMVATPAAVLLYSGTSAGFHDHEAVLSGLGEGRYLGDDAGLAAVHDSALLGMMYAAQYGVVHAMALVSAAGVSATSFLSLAQSWYSATGGFMPDLAREVETANYTTDVATLEVDSAALGHIVHASHAAGLDARVFDAIQAVAGAAVRDGHGQGSFSAIVEVLRRHSAAA